MNELGIKLGNRSLDISGYKTISTDLAKEMGVVRVERGEKIGNSLRFAKDINNFINKVALERKISPTVNVFWLKSSPDKDTIFIQAPLISFGKETPTLGIALQTDPNTREIIMKLLTSTEITQEDLKEYINQLLSPSGTSVELNRINTSRIAGLPDSGNILALTATQRGRAPFSEELSKPFKPQVITRDVNHRPESITKERHYTPVMPTMAKKTEVVEIVRPTSYSAPEKQRRLKEVKTEDETQLQKIDSFIDERKVSGKFIGEVNIHGKQFSFADYNRDNGNDYEVLPGREGTSWVYRKFDTSVKMTSFSEACYNDAHSGRAEYTPDGLNFSESMNLVYIKDPINPKITRLMIMTPNNQSDASLRPTYFCKLFCQIPTEQFEKLEALIKKNPNNAERFVEIAFAGLDKTNAKRKSVIKVALIDVDKYIPDGQMDEKNKKGVNIVFFMKKMKGSKLLDTNAVSFHDFSEYYP